MLLRRLTEHVKSQNWFAVVLDFMIVVIGILIAFQITNWNEARQSKVEEQAVLTQLKAEFVLIKTELEKQIKTREDWTKSLAKLIKALQGESDVDDVSIRMALDNATATGRRPAESAAYLQLKSNGGLSLLSDAPLRQALINYHVRLERDAFIHPALMDLVMLELSTNRARDLNVLYRTRGAAAIDEKAEQISSYNEVLSYDLEGLKQFENRYESMYVLHISLLSADEVQLELANQILDRI